MAFLESLKRLAQGKPLFDEDERDHPGGVHPPAAAPGPALTPDQTIQKFNERTFPVVRVRRVVSRPSGKNVQIYCYIRNEWTGQIMLDKIRLLGTKQELDSYLRPGEEREFLVYSGPQLTRQPDSQAEIDYKTQGGDYFQSIHDVKSNYRSDKTYSIDDMHFRRIKDIYG